MLTAGDLTKGERLLLERRRAGEPLEAAAARHGVTLYRYRLWERDEDDGAPRVPVGRVEYHEAARLMRGRVGASVRELAELVGCSPYWLTRMEAGEAPVDRLRDFWSRAARKGPRG